MTDGFSVTLTLLAGYSNFYSVVSVLICFCIMVVFILRLNGEHFMSSSATHYNTPKEQPMTKLHNPFSIQISEGKMTSLKDGLNVDVAVKSLSRTEIFWGVNIQAFQKEIHKPVSDIYTRVVEKKTFDGDCLHRVDIGINNVTERPCEFFSKCPDTVTETSLGSPPRQLYPVVVLSVMEDIETTRETQAIVAQFTIIHLKDSVCPLDSHIVYQFVKTNTNNLLSLQPIFLSSSEQDFSSQNTTREPTSNLSNTSPESSAPNNMADTSGCNTVTTNTNYRLHDSPETTNTSYSNLACNNVDRNCTDLKFGNSIHSDVGTSDSNGNTDNGVEDLFEETVEDAGIVGDYDDDDNDDTGLDETNTCIICQNAVIYYTLLPCRHACVCVSCVKLVEKCPMCRCYINAFFRLYDRDNSRESSISESEVQNDVQVPVATIWEAINQRLNDFFGFA